MRGYTLCYRHQFPGDERQTQIATKKQKPPEFYTLPDEKPRPVLQLKKLKAANASMKSSSTGHAPLAARGAPRQHPPAARPKYAQRVVGITTRSSSNDVGASW